MHPYVFPGMSPDEIKCKFTERLSLFDIPASELGEFVLFQNIADQFHYDRHFLPFREHCTTLGARGTEETAAALGRFHIYDSPEAGHGIIGVENEILLINDLLDTGRPDFDWLEEI